jgi:hypothetical protein
MTLSSPFHVTEQKLHDAREKALDELSREAGALERSAALERVAHLQMALMAVREAIAESLPHLGAGGEQPQP